MDAAYLSAFSALAGSAIGALSSLVTTWLTQNAHSRLARLNQQRTKREALYTEFIDEASRVFTDALSHEMEDLSKLVHLYSIQNKIRLFASQEIVDRTGAELSEKDPPSDTSNWLPPPAGDFNLTLRFYGPETPVLDGSYRLPAVKRAD